MNPIDLFRRRPLFPKLRAIITFLRNGNSVGAKELAFIIRVLKDFLQLCKDNPTKFGDTKELEDLITELEANRAYLNPELRTKVISLLENMISQ